jgi:hypothetical protein
MYRSPVPRANRRAARAVPYPRGSSNLLDFVTTKKDDAATRATVAPPHSSHANNFDRLVPTLKAPVSVPLGRLEMTVFTRIDGRRSVTEIAGEVGLSPFEVLRILERLMQLVPDLRVGESEVVELEMSEMDDLWDEDPDTVNPNAKTAENEAKKF